MRRITAKEMADVKARLLKAQDGCCPLCDMELTDPKDICLDHCHVTGHIRAVLCRNCNAMEGKVFNCARRAKRMGSPYRWARRVLEYWQKHSVNQTGLLHPSHRTADEKKERRNKKARKKRQALKNRIQVDKKLVKPEQTRRIRDR